MNTVNVSAMREVSGGCATLAGVACGMAGVYAYWQITKKLGKNPIVNYLK